MNCCVRSDLAIESAEMFRQEESIEGVQIESKKIDAHIHLTKVRVMNQKGAEKIGKAIGEYVTLEVPALDETDVNYHREITEAVAAQLKMLVPDIEKKRVLAAGIGNRAMAPDALGPKVAEHLFITRHLIETYGKDSEITKGMGCLSAIAPGVMAQTGIETREILEGIVQRSEPEVLLVIDALAARRVTRLNKTIQITDAGIAPGAGVGNRRFAINKETMGIPVIAIGIPTVIDAATIVNDTVIELLDTLKYQKEYQTEKLAHMLRCFEANESYRLMRETMSPEMMNMYVTPKNIDEIIEQISYTISEAINSVCHFI